MVRLLIAMLMAFPLLAQWRPLTRPGSLDGWQVVGDGIWHVMKDGTVVGQRAPKSAHQSWLYTQQEFGQYDLCFDYWIRLGANSGVSVRDSSRGRWSIPAEWDPEKTPSHIGYEIQIIGLTGQKYPSGSIYLFQAAPDGVEVPSEWNHMDIQVRDAGISVQINGRTVAQHPGDPKRPKTGPIGLQLHDDFTVVFFRDLKIREVR